MESTSTPENNAEAEKHLAGIQEAIKALSSVTVAEMQAATSGNGQAAGTAGKSTAATAKRTAAVAKRTCSHSQRRRPRPPCERLRCRALEALGREREGPAGGRCGPR